PGSPIWEQGRKERLEELSHHSVRERALKFGAAGGQHPHPGCLPPRFRLHQQRGLADPRWPLDGQEAAAARAGADQGLGGCQLGVALKEIELSRERLLGQLRTATPASEQSSLVDLCRAVYACSGPFSGRSVGDHRIKIGEQDWGSPRREAVPRAGRIEAPSNHLTTPSRTTAEAGELASATAQP